MIVDLKNLVPSVCGFYNLDLCHAATAASDHEMTLLYFLREMPQKDPCQKQACAIQKCLQANKYVESLCEDVIAEMRRCCQVHAGNSICCSGFKDSKPAESKSSE